MVMGTKDSADEIAALRALAIACRGSVKTDLNAYERLLIAKQAHGEQETHIYALAEAEAQRLFELLEKIDALATAGSAVPPAPTFTTGADVSA